MTNVRLLCLALMMDLMLSGVLSADELYLTDGRVIEGEIVSPTAAEIIDIRVGSGGLVAIQHFPRAKVERVVYGVSARQTALTQINQQVAALSKRTDDVSAAEWWTLARKLQDRGETASAKDLGMRVLALDRHHAEARKMFGMTRYHGVWMRMNEVAVARGEVFFRGAWVTWSVQEQDEAKRREEQFTARKDRDEQRRQSRIAAAAAAETEAATYPETYVSGYYRSSYYNPYGGSWYSSGGSGYPAYPYYPVVRPPLCGPVIAWHVGAAGMGSNSAWALNWNGAVGGGYHVR